MDKTNQWLTLLGNVGVIAGLIFLGLEMRQNTNIAKAGAYRDNVQDIAAWRDMRIASDELSRLFQSYMNNGIVSLDGLDRARVVGYVNNVMGIYENAYFGRGYGIIGDEEWVRFQVGACFHYEKAVENKFRLRFITPDFRQFLNEVCTLEVGKESQ